MRADIRVTESAGRAHLERGHTSTVSRLLPRLAVELLSKVVLRIGDN